jgi:hypothetical protein
LALRFIYALGWSAPLTQPLGVSLFPGKPLLVVSASAPDSAFQACIDQFEIKDGNRLRNSGSAGYAQ